MGAHSSQFKPLQKAVKLAKKLVTLSANAHKEAKEESWTHKMALDLDIELDPEEPPDSDDAPRAPPQQQHDSSHLSRQAGAKEMSRLETALALELRCVCMCACVCV